MEATGYLSGEIYQRLMAEAERPLAEAAAAAEAERAQAAANRLDGGAGADICSEPGAQNTLIQGDKNGDGVADIEIVPVDFAAPLAGDAFLLWAHSPAEIRPPGARAPTVGTSSTTPKRLARFVASPGRGGDDDQGDAERSRSAYCSSSSVGAFRSAPPHPPGEVGNRRADADQVDAEQEVRSATQRSPAGWPTSPAQAGSPPARWQAPSPNWGRAGWSAPKTTFEMPSIMKNTINSSPIVIIPCSRVTQEEEANQHGEDGVSAARNAARGAAPIQAESLDDAADDEQPTQEDDHSRRRNDRIDDREDAGHDQEYPSIRYQSE